MESHLGPSPIPGLWSSLGVITDVNQYGIPEPALRSGVEFPRMHRLSLKQRRHQKYGQEAPSWGWLSPDYLFEKHTCGPSIESTHHRKYVRANPSHHCISTTQGIRSRDTSNGSAQDQSLSPFNTHPAVLPLKILTTQGHCGKYHSSFTGGDRMF